MTDPSSEFRVRYANNARNRFADDPVPAHDLLDQCLRPPGEKMKCQLSVTRFVYASIGGI